MTPRKRVVITGAGAMTPLALTLDKTWEGLLAGRSGITTITQFDASGAQSRIAGEIKGFNPHDYMDRKEARRMARCSQVSIATAQAALADAAMELPVADGDRVGVIMGTAIGGFELSVEVIDDHRARGWGRVNPFSPIQMLLNMPSHHVSCLAGAMGPIGTEVAACASGTQAIGEAADLIRLGAADAMLCGGVEALIHFTPVSSFCAMRALSTRNDEPKKASRPFDRERDGFVYSEGCALLVLESLEHARARGATIRGEILGHASSSDAYHVAQPHPEGDGAVRAMTRALEDARVTADDVDYLNAHGTGTPINDAVETKAIKRVFGARAYEVPISSTKSMIGHAMGGAGAIEAAVCLKTIEEGVIHPTINLETPDPACDLDYVPEGSREAEVRVALSNSFGLGGQNACLVIGRFEG